METAVACTDEGFAWSWHPHRRRKAVDDPFFEEGDEIVGAATKQTGPAAEEIEEPEGPEKEYFPCQIANCGMRFTSVADYEMHYSNAHRNACSECRRHFANSHLLDIHILESHNPMFSLLSAKQNMYACLVQMCSEKFASAAERRQHLINIHKYPPNFRFHQNKEPKKKTQKKKQSEKAFQKSDRDASRGDKGTVLSDQMSSDVQDSATPTVMETNSINNRLQPSTPDEKNQKQCLVSESGRRFVYNVPKTICFGQGSQRGFVRGRGGRGRGRKHWHQTEKSGKSKVNIEEVDMADLSNALDST